jgi:hypothetical protein
VVTRVAVGYGCSITRYSWCRLSTHRLAIGDNTDVAYSMLASLGGVAMIVALLAAPARADDPDLDDVVPVPAVVEPDPAPPTPDPGLAVLEERAQAGRHWRLTTSRGAVHIWVPADYDAATAATVVFVHGYWTDVDDAWESYRLAQQFALSGLNAMFIAPEAPWAKWRPLAWPSLTELVRAVAAGVEIAMPSKRLIAVGHSGAYRTLAVWLANPLLDTVVLLDAVYAEYSFAPWVRGSKQRRLVNIVYETGNYSDYLHRQLPSTKRIDGLPPTGLPDARILYVKTDVGHWQLVTDGVALPLALRAIGVPQVGSAPTQLPLGLPALPLRCDGASSQLTDLDP